MPNGRKRLDWPTSCMKLAFNIADYRSEDSTQVGAVILKKDFSLVIGYNGAVQGQDIDWSNREEKRKRVLHAEYNATSRILQNEAQFISITHLCCLECLKCIASKNIKTVYYNQILPHYNPDDVFIIAKELGIELIKLEI